MKIEAKLPAETYLQARAGLLALDEDPEITPTVVNTAAWLEVLAANAPGEQIAAPETTVWSFDAARQVIKREKTLNMDRPTRRKIKSALRRKRREIHSAQTQPNGIFYDDSILPTVYIIPFSNTVSAAHTGAAIAFHLSRSRSRPNKQQ